MNILHGKSPCCQAKIYKFGGKKNSVHFVKRRGRFGGKSEAESLGEPILQKFWVIQWCHFHLLAQFKVQLGFWKKLPDQPIRKKIYAMVCQLLKTKNIQFTTIFNKGKKMGHFYYNKKWEFIIAKR